MNQNQFLQNLQSGLITYYKIKNNNNNEAKQENEEK